MRRSFSRKILPLIGVCSLAITLCGFTPYRRVEEEQMLAIANAMTDKGKWEEGIAQYEKYLEKNPQGFVAKKQIGMLHAWGSHWEEAEEALEEYLERVPTDVEALELLGDAYYYNDQYGQAKETYKKIIELDPALTSQYESKLNDIKLAQSSYLTYTYSYYKEKNENLDSRSASHEHAWEWNQFVKDNFFLIGSFATRIDDTLFKYTPIYGTGVLAKVFSQSWIKFTAKFEKDRTINPHARLRTVFTTIPREKYVLTVAEETVWYWDANISHSANINLSRSFLKDDSLIVMAGLYYDHIRKVSDYFVRMKAPSSENTKPLDRWEPTLTVEKSFRINKYIQVAGGETVKINSDSTKTFDTFGSVGLNIIDRWKVFLYGSWGKDSDDYTTLSGSSYMSLTF